MKVCTDSCIFGAYIFPEEAKNILDIGTGTGLLSLMLAQRSNAIIDAIEIDDEAAAQATENFKNSPWNDRLKVWPLSIQEYAKSATQQYDLIVSNPPFYSNSLKSEKERTNLAYHSTSLNMRELVITVVALLNKGGKFSVLLPPFESGLLREECETYGLYHEDVLIIRDHDQAGVLREINTFSFTRKITTSSELVIKDGTQYSGAFKDLLKPYYLYL